MANKSRGQSTIEFAIISPLVVACASVLVGLTIACVQIITLHDVARTATRIAVTSDNPTETARQFAESKGATAAVTDDLSTGLVTVVLTRKSRIPLVGRISRAIGLRASATMMREAPPVLTR